MNQIFARGVFETGSIVASETGPEALEMLGQAACLVPIGAFSCDLATDRLVWTDGVFDIFGLSSEHTLERQDTVQLYSEESRELLERKRSHAIATRSGFSLDASITRLDGIERRIRITAATHSSNGRAVTLYGMKQDITEDHARWEIMRSLAECDPLTGVANRARFQNFLKQRNGAPALDSIRALMLFDIDGFKQVNDWWGHAAGDACLIALGNRLSESFPQARLISRIGGDEFAVLLPLARSRQETEAAVSSLIGKLLRPVPWNGNMLPLGVSVGLAFVAPETGLDPQKLFLAADKALYDAKRNPSAVLVCT